jgi:hypothetical protein
VEKYVQKQVPVTCSGWLLIYSAKTTPGCDEQEVRLNEHNYSREP